MQCKLNAMELLSTNENFDIQFLNPRALQTFKLISTFFRPSTSKLLDEVLF